MTVKYILDDGDDEEVTLKGIKFVSSLDRCLLDIYDRDYKYQGTINVYKCKKFIVCEDGDER